MHFCMKDGKDMKKTVEELADKVKTDGATSETIAKEAETVMNNQVRSRIHRPHGLTFRSLGEILIFPETGRLKLIF